MGQSSLALKMKTSRVTSLGRLFPYETIRSITLTAFRKEVILQNSTSPYLKGIPCHCMIG